MKAGVGPALTSDVLVAKCRALVRPASMRTDEAAGVASPAIAFAQVRAPE
jgi:hypothetical protein